MLSSNVESTLLDDQRSAGRDIELIKLGMYSSTRGRTSWVKQRAAQQLDEHNKMSSSWMQARPGGWEEEEEDATAQLLQYSSTVGGWPRI